MTELIRIVVADDHPLFRRGVIDMLSAEEDCSVVGEAASGEEALKLVADAEPDLLLLDVSMPGVGGLAAARRVADGSPATRILMLTVSESEDDLLAALKAGATGYVLKGAPPHRVVHAVRTVAAGEVFITPALAGTVLYEMTRDKAEEDPLATLTERERQVLQLVGEGLTNKEIGDQLHLSEKTVKHYMTGVLQKLHVRSRVEAALLAARRQGAGS